MRDRNLKGAGHLRSRCLYVDGGSTERTACEAGVDEEGSALQEGGGLEQRVRAVTELPAEIEMPRARIRELNPEAAERFDNEDWLHNSGGASAGLERFGAVARCLERIYVGLVDYRDELPEDCPPGDAVVIDEAWTVYRLLYGDEPTAMDFMSRWEQDRRRGRTTKMWAGGPTGCELRGLSVYDTWEACEAQRRRERSRIGRVRLQAGAGAVRRTHGHHFVWWPSATFDILGNIEVEAQR